MNTSARTVALAALMAYRRQGIFAEDALRDKITDANLDLREAALANRLCYGVMQNMALLDFYISQYAGRPIKAFEPKILDILRLGAYQLTHLDRIAPHAAVSESVEMAGQARARAKGLVNAVLRRIAENRHDLPEPPGRADDPLAYLAVKYSHPAPLVKLFADEIGIADTESLLQANNAESALYAQTNTLRTDTESLLTDLQNADISAQRHPWLDDCLIFSGAKRFYQEPLFQGGAFYIQDPAARLAVLLADPKPGSRLLDACAAPGGKSFAAAIQMQNSGEILACDIAAKKLPQIEEGARRLGLSAIKAQTADARTADFGGEFDTVIVDAPCSGLGVIRKKPEIRYKNLAEIARLPEIQLAILQNAARQVAVGGVLSYCTCTILERENMGVVNVFLDTAKDFVLESFLLPGKWGTAAKGHITLYPHIHDTDGFFICKLRRAA